MKTPENKLDGKPLYSLIPLEDFKALLSVDDREDKLSQFCLVTATFAIEQYCKRRLLRKKHIEQIEFYGDLILPLQEYPVVKMLSAFSVSNEKLGIRKDEILRKEFYSVIPDCGTDEDVPFCLSLSHVLRRYRGLSAVKVVYWAGYTANEKLGIRNEGKGLNVPADLATACLELAAWNMNRYRGRRIGMTGSVRGSGRDGEHFEMSMPENVRKLLEPYRRKLI